jgi:hypothetical protein
MHKTQFVVTNWTYSMELSFSEKPLVAHLLKNVPTFIEPESSLPFSQEPATGPYLESDESNPYHPILFLIFQN